ncbi:MAG: AAA family ATPase [Gemmatirosa sp.]|nr:AAA family ATPase [Gemmatirosa sp.]
MSETQDWMIYRGDGVPKTDWTLPDPPPWRDFEQLAKHRAATFQPPPNVPAAVNAALYLRRPLLVTGDPGTGKSSLAYSVARELSLGDVLTWNINSRSTLAEGLYQYDALARLRDASVVRAGARGREEGEDVEDGDAPRSTPVDDEDIGRYLTLGALGTAFVAKTRPRVVLVDEIDKSDVDLPNDLLHVFEDGRFDIPELTRIAERRRQVRVATSDVGASVEVEAGRVQCRVFPIVVITSNGERDLPPAFLRRCLRIDIAGPKGGTLEEIVRAHLDGGDAATLTQLVARFDAARARGEMLATDQLLNAFYLVGQGRDISDESRAMLEQLLLRPLDRA